jgi:fimbrial chaperone protein
MALAGGRAQAAGEQVLQGLTIVPVTIELLPGQRTTVLTIENHTDHETDFQVRPFAWGQPGGEEQLTPTDALLVSPPLGRIAVGAGQVVRLVLRRSPDAQEAPYRILLDQVPPPPEPGRIGFALRLSIPVFAEPAMHVAPHVRWSVVSQGGAAYLEAVNSGGRHEVVRDMTLTAADGRRLALEANISPYILAGATRRWRIINPSVGPLREPLRLTAHADTGEIDQAVSVSSAGS